MSKPMIRFNGYDEDWEKEKLGDISDNVGGRPLEKYAKIGGEYNFISIGNYTKDGLYFDDGARIALNDKTKDRLLNKNDLVMVLNDKTTMGDLIGSTILIDSDDKYIYNQRSERIICKDTVIPYFLWSYINTKKFRTGLFKLSQGGTQIYVNYPLVKKLNINKPELDEQQQIGNFFKTIDELISAEEDRMVLLEDYKEAMLQKMFPSKGEDLPELRFEGFDEDWEENRLGDILKLKNGYSFKSSSYIDDGDYKIITISNVQGDQYVDTDSANTISYLPDNIRDHQKLDVGDILISMTGNVGRVSMIDEKDTLLNQRVGLMTFNNKEEVDEQYIFYVLRNKTFENKMIAMGQGAAQLNIGKSDIESYKLKLPSIEEQKQIGSFFKSLDASIASQKKQIKEVKEVKESFLQKMFI